MNKTLLFFLIIIGWISFALMIQFSYKTFKKAACEDNIIYKVDTLYFMESTGIWSKQKF